MLKTDTGLNCPIVCACLAVAFVAPGCGGRLDCSFVSMNMRSVGVDPTDARVVDIRCPQCWWWVDASGLLNVAAAFELHRPLKGKADRTFLISFLPGKPSRGVGKNYTITRNTVRACLQTPWTAFRLTSIHGIMAIDNKNDQTLEGAFRFTASGHTAKFLGGWTGPAPYLLFGTFRAVKDTGKGHALREETERAPFKRVHAASRPRTTTTTPR